MDLVGDRRGQSIQIGAVLLFGVLIIAFASYQAFVVPDQNREVEFNHNQQVQGQLQDLRNAIVSVGGGDDARSVSVELGTRYPSRLLARNPASPSGSLETVGTDDERVAVTVENAQAAGETGDFWNESRRYSTGGISYRPNYNVYPNAPTTVYEHTVLYNRFGTGNLTLANQSLIDGTDVSLVVLNGTLSRSSTGTASVDVQSVSSSTQRVRLTDDSGPVTITFASTRSAAYWDFLETTQPTVTDVTNASSGNGFYNVSVELERGRTYSLELTKIGVGTGVTDESAAYLTDVEGDGASVTKGETTELTLDVRDRFNNPPDDVAELTVNASVAGSGTFQSSGSDRAAKVPDEDGQVTFIYDATGSTGTQEVRFSYDDVGGSFDASRPEDVSMSLDVRPPASVGDGGGAYRLEWTDPTGDNPGAALSACSAAGCTWDVGASGDSTLTLRAGTAPSLGGLDVEFAANDSAVGNVSTTDASTGPGGEATTDVTANSNGVVGVYAASGGASDVFNLTVENTGTSPSGDVTAAATSVLPSTTGQNQSVTFSPSGSAIPAGTQLTFNFDDPQRASPRQVDYQDSSFGSTVATSNTNTPAQNADEYEITLTVGETVATTETARVWVNGVKTGPSAQQQSSYDVTVTRGDTGASATASFEVSQSAGSAELTNVAASDLQPNTNNQEQTITFEPTTDIPANEIVSISLADPQAPGQVDYRNPGSLSVDQPSASLSFADRTAENASIRYRVGSGGIAAGTTVTITVSAVDTGGMSAVPYTVGLSRGDAGTTSATFDTAPPTTPNQAYEDQDGDEVYEPSDGDFTVDLASQGYQYQASASLVVPEGVPIDGGEVSLQGENLTIRSDVTADNGLTLEATQGDVNATDVSLTPGGAVDIRADNGRVDLSEATLDNTAGSSGVTVRGQALDLRRADVTSAQGLTLDGGSVDLGGATLDNTAGSSGVSVEGTTVSLRNTEVVSAQGLTLDGDTVDLDGATLDNTAGSSNIVLLGGGVTGNGVEFSTSNGVDASDIDSLDVTEVMVDADGTVTLGGSSTGAVTIRESDIQSDSGSVSVTGANTALRSVSVTGDDGITVDATSGELDIERSSLVGTAGSASIELTATGVVNVLDTSVESGDSGGGSATVSGSTTTLRNVTAVTFGGFDATATSGALDVGSSSLEATASYGSVALTTNDEMNLTDARLAADGSLTGDRPGGGTQVTVTGAEFVDTAGNGRDFDLQPGSQRGGPDGPRPPNGVVGEPDRGQVV